MVFDLCQTFKRQTTVICLFLLSKHKGLYFQESTGNVVPLCFYDLRLGKSLGKNQTENCHLEPVFLENLSNRKGFDCPSWPSGHGFLVGLGRFQGPNVTRI